MNTEEKINSDIIVVGGGAAGLMAAGRAGRIGRRSFTAWKKQIVAAKKFWSAARHVAI